MAARALAVMLRPPATTTTKPDEAAMTSFSKRMDYVFAVFPNFVESVLTSLYFAILPQTTKDLVPVIQKLTTPVKGSKVAPPESFENMMNTNMVALAERTWPITPISKL